MRTRFKASRDKRAAVKAAESAGLVADSIDVRKRLMDQVRLGEKTLEQAQAELKKIKSGAKKRGLITRSHAYSRG